MTTHPLHLQSHHHDNHVHASFASPMGSNATLEMYTIQRHGDDDDDDDNYHRSILCISNGDDNYHRGNASAAPFPCASPFQEQGSADFYIYVLRIDQHPPLWPLERTEYESILDVAAQGNRISNFPYSSIHTFGHAPNSVVFLHRGRRGWAGERGTYMF